MEAVVEDQVTETVEWEQLGKEKRQTVANDDLKQKEMDTAKAGSLNWEEVEGGKQMKEEAEMCQMADNLTKQGQCCLLAFHWFQHSVHICPY